MSRELLFIARERYASPLTDETLIAQGAIFGVHIAHHLFAEYGIDEFHLIESYDDEPLETSYFSFGDTL